MEHVSQIYGVSSSGGREFLARAGPVSDDIIVSVVDPSRDRYLEMALSLDELLGLVLLVVKDKPPRAIRSTTRSFLEALELAEILASRVAKMIREARELDELRYRAKRYEELASHLRMLREEARKDAMKVKELTGQAWSDNWSW